MTVTRTDLAGLSDPELAALFQDKEWSEEETYWRARGNVNRAAIRKVASEGKYRQWVTIFPTKTDAERRAIGNAVWSPSGRQPVETTLAEAMNVARRLGVTGVRLMAYLDNKWEVLRTWPVGGGGS